MEQMAVYSQEDLSELVSLINSEGIYAKYKNELCEQNKRYCFVFYKENFSAVSEYIAWWINDTIGINHIMDIVSALNIAADDNEKTEFYCIAIQKVKKKTKALTAILKNKLNILSKIDNKIYLEGFIRFCTEEYLEEIEVITEEVLEEYFIKREYYEFLNLLHYFIETETPCFEHLDIVVDKDGRLSFYDKNKNDITVFCRKKFEYEFFDASVGENDFLISILILMLPKEICLYNPENISNKSILKTLKTIFNDRFIIYESEYDR